MSTEEKKLLALLTMSIQDENGNILRTLNYDDLEYVKRTVESYGFEIIPDPRENRYRNIGFPPPDILDMIGPITLYEKTFKRKVVKGSWKKQVYYNFEDKPEIPENLKNALSKMIPIQFPISTNQSLGPDVLNTDENLEILQ